jgi:hypothetical protein
MPDRYSKAGNINIADNNKVHDNKHLNMSSSNLRKGLLMLFVFNSLITHAQNNLTQLSDELIKKFITKDTAFKDPYVDIDEWRDKPVRHRYVHGGNHPCHLHKIPSIINVTSKIKS